MRVALVHDWLTGMRGGEKCLRAFLDLFPEADIYTLVHAPGTTDPVIDARVRGTSLLQRFPGVRRYYRGLLPLYPLAAKRLRVDGYDLVISLSHAAAKNITIGGGARHICYCFTPMRYVWDQAPHYFGRALPAVWPLISALRRWDTAGSHGVDRFTAISSFVRSRIRCYYGRDAAVIYPPVDSSHITPARPGSRGGHFLYAGALVPYKRVDLVVEAFNRLKLPLCIVGTGPEERRLRALAGPTVHFLGWVSDPELAKLYRTCRALIFPGTEDFGMIPVECLAAGRPVIGLCAGGVRETVTGIKHWESQRLAAHAATGVFIQHKREGQLDALLEAITYFLTVEQEFEVETCVERARLFGPERFYSAWSDLLDRWGMAQPATTFVSSNAQEEKTAV